MITEYKILRSSESTDLALEVNQHIKDGWQPYGELVVSPGFTVSHWFIQAVVRTANDEP